MGEEVALEMGLGTGGVKKSCVELMSSRADGGARESAGVGAEDGDVQTEGSFRDDRRGGLAVVVGVTAGSSSPSATVSSSCSGNVEVEVEAMNLMGAADPTFSGVNMDRCVYTT